jgi:hypothetical protein
MEQTAWSLASRISFTVFIALPPLHNNFGIVRDRHRTDRTLPSVAQRSPNRAYLPWFQALLRNAKSQRGGWPRAGGPRQPGATCPQSPVTLLQILDIRHVLRPRRLDLHGHIEGHPEIVASAACPVSRDLFRKIAPWGETGRRRSSSWPRVLRPRPGFPKVARFWIVAGFRLGVSLTNTLTASLAVDLATAWRPRGPGKPLWRCRGRLSCIADGRATYSQGRNPGSRCWIDLALANRR